VFVVDASVACKLLLNEPGMDRASEVILGDAPIIAPHFFYLEVAQVLWNAVRRNRIPAGANQKNFEAAADFQIEIVPDAEVLSEARELSARFDVAVYDGLYVALAIDRGAILATADDALCAKLRRARISGLRFELI
jgi:predicted nucleic acid-binding protein